MAVPSQPTEPLSPPLQLRPHIHLPEVLTLNKKPVPLDFLEINDQ